MMDPVSISIARVSCLPLRLPWGQARRLTLTALTGVHLKRRVTDHQSQIPGLRAQLHVSAARTEAMTMISDTGRQQMFLSLTVADLTSQFTAGTALLGPRVAELRGRSRGTNLFHFWRPDLGGEAGGKDDFQGI